MSSVYNSILHKRTLFCLRTCCYSSLKTCGASMHFVHFYNLCSACLSTYCCFLPTNCCFHLFLVRKKRRMALHPPLLLKFCCKYPVNSYQFDRKHIPSHLLETKPLYNRPYILCAKEDHISHAHAFALVLRRYKQ